MSPDVSLSADECESCLLMSSQTLHMLQTYHGSVIRNIGGVLFFFFDRQFISEVQIIYSCVCFVPVVSIILFLYVYVFL